MNNFRRQLQALGFAYDWDREVNTTDPGYVKWTQWIFIQLYNSYFCEEENKAKPVSELEAKGWTREQIDDVRLAFIHEAPVNWSPSMGTVLANEEVEEWKAKGETVERRPLRQWMLRITKYAQRLIDELEFLDWPDSIKALQRNWIGRSEGAEVIFPIEGTAIPNEDNVATPVELKLEVFTTRPDTLFGATYMVLAPEHPILKYIQQRPWPSGTPEEWTGGFDSPYAAISDYKQKCATKSDLERSELNKDKTGVFTGSYATNPVNGDKIPIWIADYVMMGYGTGAIMAVPAHDERDFEFAQKFELPIIQVVAKQALTDEQIKRGLLIDRPLNRKAYGILSADNNFEDGYEVLAIAFSEQGFAVQSDFLNSLPTAEAKAKMIDWLEAEGKGKRRINYKLRDWLFSRQRYWGEPFPLLWDKETGEHAALPESELPLLQPEMEDFKPTGDPRGPLLKATDWINYSDQYERETNTMPQWAGSCWYYLRYCDPRNENAFIGSEAETYWSGSGTTVPVVNDNNHDRDGHATGHVDLYVGGTEHAVLHLLYARFWHKVLFDLGHLSTKEPFQKLVNQGLILGEDGQKMSKSLGNVVNPDDVIVNYGADSLRLYEMFMGPLEQVKPWSMKGVEGVHRFLAKVWRVPFHYNHSTDELEIVGLSEESESSNPKLAQITHSTIKKVGEDIEALKFNTAISAMMECVNAYTSEDSVPADLFHKFLLILNPFAPHITEEINQRLNGEELLSEQTWPSYDESLLVESEITIIVQVNGKLRAKLQVPADIAKDELEAQAQADPKVKEFTDGKTIRKVIVVPGKLVNIVAS